MKKVKVIVDGTNIGEKWVKKGAEIELDDKKAEALIKSGAVELVKSEKKEK